MMRRKVRLQNVASAFEGTTGVIDRKANPPIGEKGGNWFMITLNSPHGKKGSSSYYQNSPVNYLKLKENHHFSYID